MAPVVDLSDRYCCDGSTCKPKPSTFALSNGNLWRCPGCRRVWTFRQVPDRVVYGKFLTYWDPTPWWTRAAVLARLRRIDLGAK